ncbi:hypothetical protein MOX02_28570 [Methylobacterium oxalidis]|uniref:Uncharacterized protein n=1 Tax=Methylobacterium oxalidis TaxID=944322 RepID=A0A512J4P3_9HYPH|nr:hypothetical protein MOX02_28570 [Methylobacterium oxalidis]
MVHGRALAHGQFLLTGEPADRFEALRLICIVPSFNGRMRSAGLPDGREDRIRSVLDGGAALV